MEAKLIQILLGIISYEKLTVHPDGEERKGNGGRERRKMTEERKRKEKAGREKARIIMETNLYVTNRKNVGGIL